MSDEQAYVGLKACGCVSIVAMEHLPSAAQMVSGAIRRGETVERMTVPAVRAIPFRCPDHRRVAAATADRGRADVTLTGAYASQAFYAGQQASQTLTLTDFPSPEISRALSPNGRAHWTTKRTARAEVASAVVVEATRSRLRPISGPVCLTFRWVFPEQRKRDLDNASTGVVKAAIDALVRGRWIDGDDSDTVVALTTEIRVEKGQRRLEITLATASPAGRGEFTP